MLNQKQTASPVPPVPKAGMDQRHPHPPQPRLVLWDLVLPQDRVHLLVRVPPPGPGLPRRPAEAPSAFANALAGKTCGKSLS
jgi:hypothetical protein